MCQGCPWGEEIPGWINELIRIQQLFRMGMQLTIGQLPRWKEDALKLIDEAVNAEVKARKNRSDLTDSLKQ